VRNRRLLTILLIFILIGTFAILGSALFAVRTVSVQFTNQFEFFQKEEEAQLESDLKSSVLSFTQKKNSIFGINRKKITGTIEEKNKRVRVTNIEVKFPNRLEIKVRERYPVFKLQFGDGEAAMTAVMCGQLRVLEKLDAAAFEELETNPKKARWPLITIPEEIGTDLRLEDLEIGEFLTSVETDKPYIGILQQLTPFFARLNSNEDAICNIFESVAFKGTPSDIKLVMQSRGPVNDGPKESQTYHNAFFDFIVWNAEHRLKDKLTKGWQALEENHAYAGVYQVWEQATYVFNGEHGEQLYVKVPDGILVTYREFLPSERRQ